MMPRIIVIGGGPGGYIAAARAAQLGASVTLVEKADIGGTCLNHGCIPSKLWKTTADLLERFHRADEFGVQCQGPIRPDLQRVSARKKAVIQSQIKGIQAMLQHHGVRLLKGTGYIEAPGMLRVDQETGLERMGWDRLILATGSQPMNISAFPFDRDRIWSSDDVLDMVAIPSSIVIAGGGVIGCEFAFILAALGARVTVVEALDRLLPLSSVDESCSRTIQREMKKRRIEFLLKHTVQSVEKKGASLSVTVEPSAPTTAKPAKPAESLVLEVDRVLVNIGRSACVSGIGLENIGVRTDDRGWIIVNNSLETDTKGVYAVGDALGPDRIMLAHVASMEGRIAAENAMGADRRMDYDAVPAAIFTSPEVACTGLTETQARDRGLDVRTHQVLFRALGKAHVIGDIAGQAKVVTAVSNGRILGVHLVGPHATDLIAEGTLAVRMGCRAEDVARTIHAHPTLAEIMSEVAYKALGTPVHG